MTRFHVNPDTGDVGVCRAETEPCPYIHGGSKEEARKNYEKSMSGSLFPSSDNFGKTSGTTEYTIPEHEIENARKIIDRTNRKLERLGISDRFTAEEEKFTTVETDDYGVPEARDFYRIRLNTPSISYGGYTFLAVVDREDGGLVTRTGSDVDLKGWRPENQECEHCGQKRHRSKTYLIQDRNGERHQIGSTCVEAYLGMKPEGLWALSSTPLEKLTDDEEFQKSYNHGPTLRPRDYTLAMALAVSHDGDNFVSRRTANEYQMSSTSDDILEAMEGTDPEKRDWRIEMHQKAQEYINDGKRIKELRQQIEDMDGGSDYSENLKTIANGEWVSPRATSTLVSILGFDRKRRQNESVRKIEKSWVPGFSAPPGTSVKGMKVKVVKNDVREEYDIHARCNVFRSRVVMRDEKGHQLIWWASREIKVDADDEVELKGGSVKKNDQYNGVDQTVLTRVKVDEKR